MKELAEKLNNQFKNSTPQEVLEFFLKEYKGKIGFATSLGAEDQVITDMIANIDKETKIFTLDTGRVFYETYDTIQRTNARYNFKIQAYFPKNEAVEEMVNTKGYSSFYESIENRKECCNIRKMEPLRRAFEGLDVWICGLRRDQSVTRTEMQMVEWDAGNNMIKINPIINFSQEDVWNYIKDKNVPYNSLHDKGFLSIGCAPCTRAIQEGEDIRAGRWWWEKPEHKECGLHVKK